MLGLIDSGLVEVTQDKQMSRCHLPIVVYHQECNVYEDFTGHLLGWMRSNNARTLGPPRTSPTPSTASESRRLLDFRFGSKAFFPFMASN